MILLIIYNQLGGPDRRAFSPVSGLITKVFWKMAESETLYVHETMRLITEHSNKVLKFYKMVIHIN